MGRMRSILGKTAAVLLVSVSTASAQYLNPDQCFAQLQDDTRYADEARESCVNWLSGSDYWIWQYYGGGIDDSPYCNARYTQQMQEADQRHQNCVADWNWYITHGEPTAEAKARTSFLMRNYSVAINALAQFIVESTRHTTH